MSTEWVIQDEWSEYHAMVAATLGFLLVYNEGLWEIHTLDDRLFPTDEDARNFVLAHEHDQDTQIYAYAIRAIIVGSMRGDRSNGKRGKRGEK